MSAFFTFIRNSFDSQLRNPCDSILLRKLFGAPKDTPRQILEKETVDEITFKISTVRDRLLLELMARGGLRVGEVLKLRVEDVEDQKLILRYPKSGKEEEIVFIPQKVAHRLREYIREKGLAQEDRIFRIAYAAARVVVKKAGKRVGADLSPHDLRRHAATKRIISID